MDSGRLLAPEIKRASGRRVRRLSGRPPLNKETARVVRSLNCFNFQLGKLCSQ